MREVVAGAIIADGPDGTRLLVAQRTYPAELAGLWELPGGKVAAGESRQRALRRELLEELGVRVSVGDQVGQVVPLADGMQLVALVATVIAGDFALQEHSQIRWVDADELRATADRGELVPNDAVWVPDLLTLLAPS